MYWEFLFLEKSCDSAALCWPCSENEACACSTSPPQAAGSPARLFRPPATAPPLLYIPCLYLPLPLPFCLFTPLFVFLSRCPVTLISSQLLGVKGLIPEALSKPWSISRRPNLLSYVANSILTFSFWLYHQPCFLFLPKAAGQVSVSVGGGATRG